MISAPGKLVLAGEYAVLEGYPGLATAINRRVILRPSQRVHKSALWDAISPGGFSNFEIDSSALYEHGHKLGLGSSAATAVCMAAYLDPAHAYELALEGHHRFSGGLGSGIDVAASFYGGLIRFQAGQVTQLKPRSSDTELITVYTGTSQNTRLFLKSVLDVDASAILNKLGALTPIWEQFYTRTLSEPELGELVLSNITLLKELGQKAGIEIIGAKQEKLCEIAREHGGWSKPSGAGGGDIALCFIPESKKAAFVAALAKTEFKALELDFFAQGLRNDSPLHRMERGLG